MAPASLAAAAAADGLGACTADAPRSARDVGIIAAELYVPRHCVRLCDLEAHDTVSAGKYTVGLGQEAMAFPADWEDTPSMCMTVAARLLLRAAAWGVQRRDIGRIEVGSESAPDRAKSVKSHLMALFAGADAGIPVFPADPALTGDIGGADSVNACYGGTAALLNAAAWVESADWDGRLALVVMGDIALYDMDERTGAAPCCSESTGGTRSARATGGAGAIALLVGPDAPLPLERGGTLTHYMAHAYDFYKPDGRAPGSSACSPVVHGASSIKCYLDALEHTFRGHVSKIVRRRGVLNAAGALNSLSTLNATGALDAAGALAMFQHLCFHAPYAKLVQKGYTRLLEIDQSLSVDREKDGSASPTLASPTLASPTLASLDGFRERVEASRVLPKALGNSYCASLYTGLVSLLMHGTVSEGERIGMFAYGSGLASTFFSILPRRSRRWGKLEDVLDTARIAADMEGRCVCAPTAYEAAAARRLGHVHAGGDWRPRDPPPAAGSATVSLSRIDGCLQRTYTWTQ